MAAFCSLKPFFGNDPDTQDERQDMRMNITSEDRMSCSVHLSESGRSVIILDQRKLPNRQEYMELQTAEEMYDAIRTLAVRGAPAIGICAAYSVYVLALKEESEDYAAFASAMEKAGEYLRMHAGIMRKVHGAEMPPAESAEPQSGDANADALAMLGELNAV